MKTSHLAVIFLSTLFILSASALATANKLDIDKVVIDVDGDQEFSGSGSSGNLYVEPDTEIEIEVTVENMWDRDSDDALRIEDVEINAVLHDIDDGDDLTYSSSRFDLRAEGYKTIRWDWDIPEDVDSDQNYELEITVQGYDEEGELHEDEMVIDVEVERERHELIFKDIEVDDPSPCSDSARVRIEVENKGENDEDVEFRIESDYKGELFSKDFEIEAFDSDDNEYTLTRTIDVSGWNEGKYTLDFILEYDGDEITESETLRIADCWEQESDSSSQGKSNKQSGDDNWDGDQEEYYQRERSRNIELFKQVTGEGKGVQVVVKDNGYVPPPSAFEPQTKKKGTDWGFAGLIVADIILLLVVIVGLVMLVIHFFEL